MIVAKNRAELLRMIPEDAVEIGITSYRRVSGEPVPPELQPRDTEEPEDDLAASDDAPFPGFIP